MRAVCLFLYILGVHLVGVRVIARLFGVSTRASDSWKLPD